MIINNTDFENDWSRRSRVQGIQCFLVELEIAVYQRRLVYWLTNVNSWQVVTYLRQNLDSSFILLDFARAGASEFVILGLFSYSFTESITFSYLGTYTSSTISHQIRFELFLKQTINQPLKDNGSLKSSINLTFDPSLGLWFHIDWILYKWPCCFYISS